MNMPRRLALLIDGDNAQATLLPLILEEVAKRGTPIIRNIYGDWTEPQMKSWKDTLNGHAIQPVQQFRYTTGKNATDSALIIDAMDMLYNVKLDGFCLVSSDSDYTRLAMRIREKGLFVLGIGRASTPEAFRNACEEFVCTDDLHKPAEAPAKPPAPPAVPPAALPPAEPPRPTGNAHALKKSLTVALNSTAQANGWVSLAALGSTLRQLDPGFDPHAYGYEQLSQLVEAQSDLLTVKKEQIQDGTLIYAVRLKNQTPRPIEALLAKAFDLASQEDGWAMLTALGDSLHQIEPDFDPRTYGYKQLSQLVEAYPDLIEVDKVRAKGNGIVYCVRMKGRKQPIEKLLIAALKQASPNGGWAKLETVGNLLRQLAPGFEPRTYGHKQLSQLVEAYPYFIEIKKTGSKGGIVNYHVRLKKV